jgi:hypothetical protein
LARGQRAQLATRGRLFRFWEREGNAFRVPDPQKDSAGRRSVEQRQRITKTAPSHGATRAGEVTASQVRGKAVARKRCAAAAIARAAGARPARREAREPAGQHKDAAPSGARSAGQSASANPPAHFSAPDRHPNGAETAGSVRANEGSWAEASSKRARGWPLSPCVSDRHRRRRLQAPGAQAPRARAEGNATMYLSIRCVTLSSRWREVELPVSNWSLWAHSACSPEPRSLRSQSCAPILNRLRCTLSSTVGADLCTWQEPVARDI